MARTEEGGLLTIRHRQGQNAVRAQMLRDFTRIWPIWNGNEETFRLLVSATIPLVSSHRTTSSALATSYYDLFRRIEKVDGSPTPHSGNPLDQKAVERSLYVTGMNSVKKSLDAGFSVEAAKQNAFVRVSGAMTRHTLNGGRGALIQSVASDPAAGGYARVTGDPCAFCAMLASRGAVYSEDTADFQAHDHCACGAEPQYEGANLPGKALEYRRIWNEVVSGDPGSGALNDFRTALADRSE